MQSNWVYFLVGGGLSAQNMFQRRLLFHLCGVLYERLPGGRPLEIAGPKPGPNGSRIFVGGLGPYSPHAAGSPGTLPPGEGVRVFYSLPDGGGAGLAGMIREAKQRSYQACGVFLPDRGGSEPRQGLAALDWDERIWLAGSATGGEDRLDREAKKFAEHLQARAGVPRP